MTDLRCESKKHGVLLGDDVIEIKCDSRFCGARSGVVVLHRFDKVTGELLETLRYRDHLTGGVNNATHHHPSAIRSA